MTVHLSLLSNLYIINRFLLQKLCNIVLKPLKRKFTKTHMPFSKMARYHGMTRIWLLLHVAIMCQRHLNYLASSACSNNVSETFKLFGFFGM
jgi:hypothetical protein